MINNLFPSCILRRGSCCFPLAWNLTSPGTQMRTVLPILVNEWSLIITVLVRIFYSLAFANWRVFFLSCVLLCGWPRDPRSAVEIWSSSGWNSSLRLFLALVRPPHWEELGREVHLKIIPYTETQQTALVRKREVFRREGACCFGWCQGMIPSTFLYIQLFTGEGWEVSLLV